MILIFKMKISIPIFPLQVEQGGLHLLVKSRFDFKIKGYSIIDTGASISAFDKNFCEQFSELLINIKDIQSSGITKESLNAVVVKFNKFYLSKYSFEINQAVLIDLSHINSLYKQFTNKLIIGIIGGNFLEEHKAVINYKSNKLILDTF
ncbi:MAG: hypothetical protein COS14_12355 [Bacteroidetes bacterium CG02_land_8_20_14_3_00_31_25]|nr:MAG: hypothetical protein COS14_12355 [Bacteroidetes bacterium CG02_land_8_20_14_3_00_31_25]PIY02421.1 MAG: hypothetical protein COZ21_14250 [Bacteroidetes bacterium CG_4_10_14_3_um_filter_31_20]